MAELILRDITENELYGLQGATSFKDGTKPQVLNYGPLMLIVSSEGIQVFIYNAELDEDQEFALPINSDYKEYALDIVNYNIIPKIKGMTPKQMMDLLIDDLGFNYLIYK